MKIGAALIPLVGWGIDAEQPEPARRVHLIAIRRLVEEFGLEAARIILGHRSTAITEVYAEKDEQQAIAAAAKVG